jgi:hypothetical protein
VFNSRNLYVKSKCVVLHYRDYYDCWSISRPQSFQPEFLEIKAELVKHWKSNLTGERIAFQRSGKLINQDQTNSLFVDYLIQRESRRCQKLKVKMQPAWSYPNIIFLFYQHLISPAINKWLKVVIVNLKTKLRLSRRFKDQRAPQENLWSFKGVWKHWEINIESSENKLLDAHDQR